MVRNRSKLEWKWSLLRSTRILVLFPGEEGFSLTLESRRVDILVRTWLVAVIRTLFVSVIVLVWRTPGALRAARRFRGPRFSASQGGYLRIRKNVESIQRRQRHRRSTIYLVSVQSGRCSVVALLNRQRVVPVRLSVEKFTRLPVASYLHLLELRIFPFVHRYRTNERQVDSEASMLAGTLETYPYSVGDWHPLWIVGSAFEAFLRFDVTKLWDGRAISNWYGIVVRLSYAVFIPRFQFAE